MKKILVFVVVLLIVLCGCGINSESNNKTHISFQRIELEYNGVEVLLNDVNESNNSTNKSINFSLTLLNKNPKVYKYSIENIYVIRESNKAEYVVSKGMLEKELNFELQCDLSESVRLYASIPTSLTEDNYYLSYKENNNEIRINLYDKPINEYKDVLIEWNVYTGNNYVAYKTTAKEYHSVLDYSWISDDYRYSSMKWYTDSDMTCEVTDNVVAKEGMKLYGNKQSIFEFSSYYNFTYIIGIIYIPHNGKVFLPNSIDGITTIRLAIISLYSIDKTMAKELYIPFNIIGIEEGCSEFLNMFEDIYYEGDEEQFKSLCSKNWTLESNMHYNEKWGN